MDASLADSFRYCESLARREAGNFYPAFRILPREQRRAMCALYAYMRIADDCGDDEGSLEQKTERLNAWRAGLHAALRGDFVHPVHPALAHIVERYRIPPEYLEAVLDGVAMDLGPVTYETFEQLRLYCYRVASVVGLCCIRIWGAREPAAERYAEDAGIAFQLTNILRDLREDAERGRVYLPAEDFSRFGYSRDALVAGRRDGAFRELMRFEIARARSFYEASEPLLPLLERPGRAVFLMMSRTYRGLLEAIEARDYDVFSGRVRVSSWRKLQFALGVLPVRYGWR
jgi:phytoene synthase